MLLHVRERRPARRAWRLEREVDDVFRRALGFDWSTGGRAAAPLEVIPDADGVTVRAEIPGVDPSAIAIGVEGRTLTITAERPAETRQGAYRLRERACGTFSRAFRLADDLDAEAISAEAKHGVLTVRIPRRADAKPRQIEVRAA